MKLLKLFNRGKVAEGDYAATAKVTQYLNRASRGLLGKERARLRDELSIHIDGLVNSYRMSGTPLDDAVDKALLEMGPAVKVSVGIARLNTLPLLTMMSLFACLVITVFALLAPTVAQSLTPLNTVPIEECINDDTTWYCRAEDWVNLDELKTLLEQNNITVNKVGDNLFLKVPGYDKVLVYGGSLTYTFYGGPQAGVTRSTNTGYVQIRTVLEALATAGIPVKLGGWDTLNIDIADKSFELTFDSDYNAQDFYIATLNFTLTSLAPAPSSGYVVAIKTDVPTNPYRFDLDVQEGDVYGVLVAVNEKTFGSLIQIPADEEPLAAFYYDIVHVEADGGLTLNLPDMEEIEFTSTAETMAGNGKAVLVKLTGEVSEGLYKVIPPEEIRLEPLK